MLVFSIDNYNYLKKDLLSLNKKLKEGLIERKQFPDGEVYLRLMSDVKNKDVLLIGGTDSDKSTLELYDLGCAISKYGAKSLSIFIPYFGYSTMERSTKSGEVVVAKTRARLFSAIPQSKEGNRIYLLDLHSEGIPYYFEGNVTVSHVYAKKIVLDVLKEINKKSLDIVLGSTDAGRAKWVESIANEYGCEGVYVYKKRISGNETKLTGINANVSNKHVIIYDDMIRTGGSLIQAAIAYKNAGAIKITAITSHGVFPKINGENSIKKLLESGLFEEIYMTNSHPTSQEMNFEKVKVLSISNIINSLF